MISRRTMVSALTVGTLLAAAWPALAKSNMIKMFDTDNDGTISHDEYIAYQSKVFDMMDTSTTHKGQVGKEEVMLATGGYNTHK